MREGGSCFCHRISDECITGVTAALSVVNSLFCLAGSVVCRRRGGILFVSEELMCGGAGFGGGIDYNSRVVKST